MSIRESRSQRSFDSSTGLIAVFHALHRLLAPRHPPHALSSLTALTSPSSRDDNSPERRIRCQRIDCYRPRLHRPGIVTIPCSNGSRRESLTQKLPEAQPCSHTIMPQLSLVRQLFPLHLLVKELLSNHREKTSSCDEGVCFAARAAR